MLVSNQTDLAAALSTMCNLEFPVCPLFVNENAQFFFCFVWKLIIRAVSFDERNEENWNLNYPIDFRSPFPQFQVTRPWIARHINESMSIKFATNWPSIFGGIPELVTYEDRFSKMQGDVISYLSQLSNGFFFHHTSTVCCCANEDQNKTIQTEMEWGGHQLLTHSVLYFHIVRRLFSPGHSYWIDANEKKRKPETSSQVSRLAGCM